MNSDQSLSSPDVKNSLVEEIRSAESVIELNNILETIKQKEDHENIKASLVLDVFDRMKRMTSRDPAPVKELIVDGLLEWCFQASGENGQVSTRQSHEFRDLLKSWLYQYSFDEYFPIRKAIIDEILAGIDTHATSEQMWLIAAIGLRTNEIVQRLERLLSSPDQKLADSALFVLARLGSPPENRRALLKHVSECIQKGDLGSQRGVIVAVEEMCSGVKPELVIELLKVAERELEERNINFSLCFNAASRIAEQHPLNQRLHQSIWNVFKQHWRTMRMTPSYANSCNTEDTLLNYVNSFVDEATDDSTAGEYITLSRISELVSPNQLEAWTKVDLKKVAPLIQELATLDTRIEGRFVTTSLRLKKEGWHFAMAAGIPNTDQWIDASILDEMNPESARQAASIIACSKPKQLSERFLTAIQQEPVGEEWTRHLGLIEIARSCGDERSLDALLNFGLTRDGHVLLSTLDAIIDCSLEQARSGNYRAIQKVLEKTSSGKIRHRDASIAAFCELATEGVVERADLAQLWEFANNKSLDEFSRKRAFEAISFSEAEISAERKAELIELGQEDGELSWRACEVLVKRNQVKLEEEPWLFNKLKLGSSDGGLQFDDADEIPIWQAYLIGRMFVRTPDKFSNLISKMILVHSDKSLYQLLNPLKQIGTRCPKNVSLALAQRIQKSHSFAKANIELIRILRIVSPSRLYALAKLSDWQQWLPIARACLADQIGQTVADDSSLSNEAATLLLPFLRDASYQVRRSAYRAMAFAQQARLRNQCYVWSRTADVEFRKRGAEATSWLASDAFPDPSIASFGFDWDPEKVVRETSKGTTQRRWRMALARKYTNAFIGECKNASRDEALRYRYARALELTGDDETVNQIREFASREILSSHLSHLIEQTVKAIQKNWTAETKKWPDPWAHETGVVEELQGELIIEGKQPFDAQFTLTCDYQKTPSDLGEWKARAIVECGPNEVGLQIPESPVTIRIENRMEAKAYVFDLRWMDGNTKAVYALGGGLSDYPTDIVNDGAEQSSLHEMVRDVISSSRVSLKSADEIPEKVIAEVIERAESDFFESSHQLRSRASAKQACQTTAVVLASIVAFFEDEDATSVLLWQISNGILDRNGLALPLVPCDADLLQQITRRSDAGSPDELLFWLIERVVDSDPVSHTSFDMTLESEGS